MSTVIAVSTAYSGIVLRRRNAPGSTVLIRVNDYVLFCASWVLLVIAFNWIFEPFGPYLLPREEKNLYGIMLSAPALILARYALRQMLKTESALKNNDK